MKILIDKAIPFLEGLFEPYAEVTYLAGDGFTPEIVHDADALIIRTRTKCNATLLDGSSVRIIATATIGYDHIDLDYCQKNNIKVTTAAGCNARGVLQWVGAGLAYLSKRDGWRPEQIRLGVVGVGNVGSLIAEYGEMWGFDVVCCDPPRGVEGFVSLDEMLPTVDIITFHTPLDTTTHHMLNSQNIKQLKPSATIINTSRGEVIESQALLDNPSHTLMLDVWEREPNVDPALINQATIATYHIAGYSRQGKANGSAMSVKSIAEYFGLPISNWYPNIESNTGRNITWEELTDSIPQRFDIEDLSLSLKSHPEMFETMRNNYIYRNEYF